MGHSTPKCSKDSDGAVAVLRYLRELFARDDYAPFEDDGYRTLMFSTERAIARHTLNTPAR